LRAKKLELTLIAGLFWLSWRLRKATRKIREPQPIRIEVHHYWHEPDGGPGEEQPVESAPDGAQDAGNVVRFPQKAA
jgi:hypothetical protein